MYSQAQILLSIAMFKSEANGANAGGKKDVVLRVVNLFFSACSSVWVGLTSSTKWTLFHIQLSKRVSFGHWLLLLPSQQQSIQKKKAKVIPLSEKKIKFSYGYYLIK